MPLEEWLDPIPRLLPEVAAAPLRVIDDKSVRLGCNWKILAEAFLEVYHARTIHPKTVGPSLDTRGTVISLFDHGHQNMLSPVNRGTRSANGVSCCRCSRASPRSSPSDIQPAYGIFPNLITPLDAAGLPDPAVLAAARSTAPAWTSRGSPPTGARARCLPEQREIWDARLTRFDTVMDEDYENLEPIQRSMETAAHGGQVINYQERRIWHVQAWIDKVIGPDRIPEHLRVPDLLADWVEQRLSFFCP